MENILPDVYIVEIAGIEYMQVNHNLCHDGRG